MTYPDHPSLHIGRNIKRIREIKGIKQGTVALALGASQQSVSNLEKKEFISTVKLEKIACLFGMSAEDICSFREDQLEGALVQDDGADPLRRIEDLYERLLEQERQKNHQLLRQIHSASDA